MLVENPKVLVEFVKVGLGQKHAEMIEWMIQPEKLPQEMKRRAFLFEVIYYNRDHVNCIEEYSTLVSSPGLLPLTKINSVWGGEGWPWGQRLIPHCTPL